MAFTATVKLDNGESFTATGISYRSDTGKLEFTGSTAWDTRATDSSVRVDSATAGGVTMSHVVSVTVA
jgi:hypothetical protein